MHLSSPIKLQSQSYTWRQIPFTTGVPNTGVNIFASETYVFLETRTELIWSNNNGSTWVRTNKPPGRTNIPSSISDFLVVGATWFACVYQDEQNIPVIYRSTNNGTTWLPCLIIEGGTAPVTPGFAAAYTLKRSGTRLIAGTTDGIYLSDDNGSTWRRTVTGLPRVNGDKLAFYVASVGGAIIATSAGSLQFDSLRIWRSTDNGNTWSGSSGGLTRPFAAKDVASIGSNLYSAFTEFIGASFTARLGAFTSSNAGLTWSNINTGLSAPSATSSSWLYYTTAFNSNVYVVDGASLSTRRLMRYNGTSWVREMNGLPDVQISKIAATSSALFALNDLSGVIYTIAADGITAPAITSLSPANGLAGTSITITGTNFTGASAVRFGTTSAATFTVVGPTQITATVLSSLSAGTYPVTVITPGGTSNAVNFTVDPPPPPVITSIMPASGTPGTDITLNVSNLVLRRTLFGGEGAIVSVTSGGSTTATFVSLSSSGAMTFSGTVRISVPLGTDLGAISITITGQNGTSLPATFTVTAPPLPTIASFTPTSGATGSTVTITGTNLSSVTAVQFGGINASAFSFNSTTGTISVTIPGSLSPGVYPVTVITPVGNSNNLNFTVSAPPSVPTVVGFAPLSAFAATTVRISGTNFTGATAVNIGSTPVTDFTVVSSILITAIVPSGIAGGRISVTTPAGTATSVGSLAVLAPVQTLSGISPARAGIGETVTISGENLTGITGVSFGGVNATSFSMSPDGRTMTAVVGWGLSGDVRVVSGRGTATLPTAFTFLLPTPSITSIAPTSIVAGQLSVLTIDGANLLASTVSVTDGTGASIPATQMSNTATRFALRMMPTSAGTARIRLTNGGGDVTAPTVTILPPLPSITGYAPWRARAGDTVVITGTNFLGITNVSFGGVPANIIAGSNTATEIGVIVGSGSSGRVQVSTVSGTATSLTSFVFDPSVPATITSISPTSGTFGTEVTITGTNFPTNILYIEVGDVWGQTIVSNSSTQIVFRVNTSTQGQSGRVRVVFAGGLNLMSAERFTCTVPTSLAVPVPTLPANGTIFSSTSTYTFADFAWTPIPAATSYTYQFSLSPIFATDRESQTFTYETSFTRINQYISLARTGQPPLAIYWRVRANNNAGGVQSEWSATQQVLGLPRISLLSATPSEIQKGTTVSIVIMGQSTDLTRASGVRLTIGSTTIMGSIQAGATPTQCTALFTIPVDAPTGFYTLTVNNAPLTVSLENTVSITPSSGEPDAPVTTGFNTLVHGFNFPNSEANIWPPSAWRSIDYTSAAYPAIIRAAGVRSSAFPSFDDFAAITDLNITGTSREPFYTDGSRYPGSSPSAVNELYANSWIINLHDWGGSCDGMSQVALLNYAGIPAYQFSATPFNLGSRLTNDNLRKLINRHQLAQTSEDGGATVNENLGQLRTDLSSGDPLRHRRIWMFPPEGMVGHSVIPTGITTSRNSSGQVIDRIAIYDVNLPGDLSPFIEINRTLNTWSYPMYGPAWSGSTGFSYAIMTNQIRHFTSRPGPIAMLTNDGLQTITVGFTPSFQTRFGVLVAPQVSLLNSHGGRIAASGEDAISPSIPGAKLTRTTGGLPPNFTSFVNGFTFPNFQGSEAFTINYTPVATDRSNRLTVNGVVGSMSLDWTASSTTQSQSIQINTQNPVLNITSQSALSDVGVAYFVYAPQQTISTTRRQNIIRLSNTTIAANQSLQTSVEPASSSLTLIGDSVPRQYDLTLARDTTVLAFPRIPMNANEQHQIRTVSWDNLRTSQVLLIITRLTANGSPKGETRVLQLNPNATTTSVRENNSFADIGTIFILPNPASDKATLEFTLPTPTFVTIDVVNMLGQIVFSLPAEPREAGQHSVLLNTSALVNGMYICRVKIGQQTRTVLMSVVR